MDRGRTWIAILFTIIIFFFQWIIVVFGHMYCWWVRWVKWEMLYILIPIQSIEEKEFWSFHFANIFGYFQMANLPLIWKRTISWRKIKITGLYTNGFVLLNNFLYGHFIIYSTNFIFTNSVDPTTFLVKHFLDYFCALFMIYWK